jgi:cytochrome c oxidase subunit I+III
VATVAVPHQQQQQHGDQLTRTWSSPTGVVGRLSAVQQNVVGLRIIITGFVFLLLGGINALLMRTQLAVPNNDFLSPQTYNELFTMHGTTMMFLFAVPIVEGFGNYLVPLLIGARDLAFPRLTAFGYWCFLFGGIFLYASFFVGQPPSEGWFAYVPLSGPEYSGIGMDFWLLGTSFIEVSTLAAAIELIVSIFKLRAPGMSINLMPPFAWAILVMAFMIIFGFLPLVAGSTMLELDRALGTQFFNTAAGGSTLLWQHLFWIFGHPEVYVMLLPGLGIVSSIVVTFSRRPLIGYTWVVVALVAIGFISFGLWVHHMFAVGLPELALSFFSATSMLIVLANGANIFAWLATIWRGAVSIKTPFLFILGFFFIFILGGITGAMVGSPPFDRQVHDTYFVVAHFHYVIFGGLVFPVFAAFSYWFPKVTGKLLHEGLGKLTFWLMFLGFNIAFFPMHFSGFEGMPRRVYTYDESLGIGGYNLVSTIGAFMVALGVLVFILNAVRSLSDGEKAGNNPWGASTLEWGISSPIPPYSFRVTPVVHSRDPLWDQPDLPEQMEGRIPEPGLPARLSTTRREGFATTLLDAVPDYIVVFAGPSLWPLALASGLAMFFVGTLMKLWILAALSVPVSIIALAAWNWPQREEGRGVPAADDEAARGFPVDVSDARSTGWWGMMLLLICHAVIFGSFLIAYFYLAGNNPVWPPNGVPLPQPMLAIGAFVLAVVAAVAARVAVRGVVRGNQGRLLLGLGIAVVLGLAALALAVVEIMQQPFGLSDSAYASSVLVILGLMALQTAVAVIFALIVFFWAWRGYYTEGRYLAVRNVSLYWIYVAAAWLVTLLAIYGSPYWLGLS